ncbi:MAG: hypothetical protein A4E66_00082 [Syntrophus sp. PtaB.Bin001]|nr:MAG: hypothetical protein A4E66_00082 [Syntrophus sp. PtaB.Bin001]
MSGLATTAMTMSMQRVQEQMMMSMLKADAKAQQQMVNMLMENAERIQADAGQAKARGGVDIYV